MQRVDITTPDGLTLAAYAYGKADGPADPPVISE